jgi:hypothetical protein
MPVYLAAEGPHWVECGHPLGTVPDLRPANVGGQSLTVFDAFS